MTNTPRSESPSPTARREAPSEAGAPRKGQRAAATPPPATPPPRKVTRAEVPSRQEAPSAMTVATEDKQDAVAARVNRQQAAVAAAVRASQEASRPMKAAAAPLARAAAPVEWAAGSAAQVLTFPFSLGRAVAEDIVSTARRPDAVLYWAGLAGLAALGALEWPAAAAVGVGIAIASGRRRQAT
jgi:hypothetical protein